MTKAENINSLDMLIETFNFNSEGLIPAITQDYSSKDILMMAWMNREAIFETLQTGRVCYFSRSRQKLWRKGETSGQVQTLKTFRVDCDRDTILLLVDQVGVACHTGRRSCFYEEVDKNGTIKIISGIITSPDKLYSK